MKITEWEEYVIGKYGAKKVVNFEELREYLTNPEHYCGGFTPEEVTETEIMDDEFYAAYVFDENQIAKRNVVSYMDSCWNTSVVFLGTHDGENIYRISMHDSNGMTRRELDRFYVDIDPKNLDKTHHKIIEK